MVGSSKSKTKLLLMLAQAGWDPVGRIFHSSGQQLVSFSTAFRFSAQDQLPLPDLVLPQLPPQQTGGPRGSSRMPSSGPGIEGAVDRKAKPRERQSCSEVSQEGSHQVGDAGAKSYPSIGKINPNNRIFSPLTDTNTCKRQVFFSLETHYQMGFATRRCEG